MEEKLNKKQIVSLVVGVLTLVILIFGATYAYFQVAVSDTSGTTTIFGDIGGSTLGTVTLTGGDDELYLGISPYDMSENKKGTIYYSSITEGSRETSKASAGKTTYTATLSGDTTNTVMYACDYEFTVSATGTMLGKDSTEDVEVVFEGDINKTLPLSSSNTVSGTWYGFKESNKERNFNVYLQFTNTEIEQNDIAGTNLAVEIENSKFECYLSEKGELVGEAYALLVDHPESGYSQLVFLRSETPIQAGELYEGNTILKAATGFENKEFSSGEEVPWNNYTLVDVIVKDEIRPISMAYWFSGTRFYMSELVLTNLDTSNVTDMSHMFEELSGYLNTIDFSNLDISNVTDMSYMFYHTKQTDDSLNLSGWDVSNVTNMSHMFSRSRVAMTNYYAIYGIDGWDVSNVTDMSNMFSYSNFGTSMDLSSWDVSNVIDMSGMFSQISTNSELNLSGWDVSSVTNMSNMFENRETDPYQYTVVGLNGWDVSKVTDMSGMFYMFNPGDGDETNLSNWNVSGVVNMQAMFMYCGYDIEEWNLSSWDVSNVTNMSMMFAYTELCANNGLQNWDVSKVTNMNSMFSYTGFLDDVDLSGWDVSRVTDYQDFNGGYRGYPGTLTIPPKFA